MGAAGYCARCAAATAAVIVRVSGRTAAPSTRTVGVASTPECGGTCGDIRRPVEVARTGQAAGERGAAQPHGTADAGQFGVVQPRAALSHVEENMAVANIGLDSEARDLLG
jgi:hypothetical protein